ncbi:hypothetical protein [Natranaerofaba carboxydovora]|uniref:hypothetical protein n=1 Tax=Natranaerofaba carboxydovora TaxID=2742683 RepID=UPI001F135706|nr:hypothetical protein [Natranaerofaba carboxydovora]UMZ74225.1 hypothetical protein ACONDI_01810 [Natranaerofaba carboxydovora]
MKQFDGKDNYRKKEKLTKALKSIEEFIEADRLRKEEKTSILTTKQKLQKAREDLQEFLDEDHH